MDVSCKSSSRSIALLFCIITSGLSHAEDVPLYARANGVIQFGAERMGLDSNLQIDSDDNGKGTRVDVEDDLGFDEHEASLRFSGFWRIAPKHRVAFSVTPLFREASATLSRDIEIEGDIIKAGANVETDYDVVIGDVHYLYSPLQLDQFELGMSAGMYHLIMDIDLDASGTVSENGADFVPGTKYDYDNDGSIPFPLVGIQADFYPNPKLKLSAKARLLSFEFDDLEGDIVFLSVGADFAINEHVGIGLSASRMDMEFDADDFDDVTGTFEWEHTGVEGHISLKF
ncbi:MAG: hypothetical protein MI864_13720 [Pseudomonadales bacterium]|nr:hypothetical protein [Pseudomonadales bacterium]